jgi:hypothetical protein
VKNARDTANRMEDAAFDWDQLVTIHYYDELTGSDPDSDCEGTIKIDTLQAWRQAPVELRALAALTVETLQTFSTVQQEEAKAICSGCTEVQFSEQSPRLLEKLDALVTELRRAKEHHGHSTCRRYDYVLCEIVIDKVKALVEPQVRALFAQTSHSREVLWGLVTKYEAQIQEATEVQADIERKIEIDTVLLGEYENAVQKQIEVCAQLGKRKTRRQLAKELCTSEVVLRQVAGTSCSVTEL